MVFAHYVHGFEIDFLYHQKYQRLGGVNMKMKFISSIIACFLCFSSIISVTYASSTTYNPDYQDHYWSQKQYDLYYYYYYKRYDEYILFPGMTESNCISISQQYANDMTKFDEVPVVGKVRITSASTYPATITAYETLWHDEIFGADPDPTPDTTPDSGGSGGSSSEGGEIIMTLTETIAALGETFEVGTDLMTAVGNMIVGTPILLIPIGLGIVGTGIALFQKLKNG